MLWCMRYLREITKIRANNCWLYVFQVLLRITGRQMFDCTYSLRDFVTGNFMTLWYFQWWFVLDTCDFLMVWFMNNILGNLNMKFLVWNFRCYNFELQFLFFLMNMWRMVTMIARLAKIDEEQPPNQVLIFDWSLWS